MKSLAPLDIDVLVIGHGVSGLAAGSFIASCGRKVAIVGAGTPWTALSTSCFSAFVGRDENARKALSFLRPRLKRTGLPLVGEMDRRMEAITHVGNLLPISLAPEFSAVRKEGEMTVMGLEGHPDLDARMVASNLRSFGILAQPFSMKLPGIENQPTAFQFAQRFDEATMESLRNGLSEIGSSSILIPPIFLLEDYARSMKSLQGLGQEVKELVTPLSLPGLRFQEALETVSIAEGIKLLKGREAISLQVKGNEASEALISSGLREQRIDFSILVIASGDLTLSNARGMYLSSVRIVEPEGRSKLHQALKAGLVVNDLQAVSREGRTLRNVFVCGAALPRNNFVLGKGMMGAIGSAWRASRLIAGGV